MRRRNVGSIAVAVVVAGVVALGASAPPTAQAESETLAGPPAEDAPVAYTVRIEGVEDSRIRTLLERSSQLITLRDRAPMTEAGLLRRITDDFERFRRVLRSEGFYDSTIDYRIDEAASPPAITVEVSPGPPYTLKEYTVSFETTEGATTPEEPPLATLGLAIGRRARAADVIAAERKLFDVLAAEAYPLARQIDREAIVDHRDQSMTVHLRVDPGPFAHFGPLALEGLGGVREDYARTLVPWREGDPFDQRLVDEYRRRLVRSGLFATVVVETADALAADGTLAMTVRLVEAKHRSVGAGAKYDTSEGPAVEVFWEHRNLFHRNEDLRITLEVGQIRQEATVDFLRPDFRRPEQDLLAQAQATRQTTDAFDEIGVSTTLGVRRPLTETWTAALGTSLEWSRLDENDQGAQSSTLLGFPSAIYRDSTDDLLDPTRGMRLRLDATPYVGWFDQRVTFLQGILGGSTYAALDADRRYVLAGRARVGSILGQSREDIPPNKRFYAGGGDSVRGYEFQKVGPLDRRNDPLGGRSLLEVSAEFRARVWGNIAVVPFVDGGNVYTPVLPEFDENLRWAAGIGARYHTVVGPVRVDVAFPLNRREDVDDPYQFYISLGQAF